MTGGCRILEFNGDGEVSTASILRMLSINLIVLILGQGDPIRDILVDAVDLGRVEVASPARVPPVVSDLDRGEWETTGQIVGRIKVQPAGIIARQVESVLASGGCLEVSVPKIAIIYIIVVSRLKDQLQVLALERVRVDTIDVGSLSIVGRVVLAAGKSWLAGLSHTVRGGASRCTSYAGDFIHLLFGDGAGDTGHGNVYVLLEAPTREFELLAAIRVTLVSTDGLDLGVRAHRPAIVASEVAVASRVADLRIAAEEARTWHALLRGLLVSDHCCEPVETYGIETVALVNGQLVIGQSAIDSELLDGTVVGWRIASGVDFLHVDPKVRVLVLVHLVGDHVVQNRSVHA